jgi:hypothetical protein
MTSRQLQAQLAARTVLPFESGPKGHAYYLDTHGLR